MWIDGTHCHGLLRKGQVNGKGKDGKEKGTSWAKTRWANGKTDSSLFGGYRGGAPGESKGWTVSRTLLVLW